MHTTIKKAAAAVKDFDIIKVAAHLYAQIPRQVKVTFVSTTIIGLLSHCFLFSARFMNEDAISSYMPEYGIVAMGRWMRALVSALRLDCCLPALIVITSVLYLSCAATIIVKLLAIQSSVLGSVLARYW